MNNLAITLGDQGRFEEAAAIERAVLEKRKRIPGDVHPDTVWTLRDHAATIQAQGMAADKRQRLKTPSGPHHLLTKFVPKKYSAARGKDVAQLQ